MKYYIAVLIFAIVFSLEMLLSGIYTDQGLILRGVNKSDGIWNLALIEELKHHFPPQHPGFSELTLKGYHFLFHELVAMTSTITFLPTTFLYFQIFPLIISFMWGLGVFKVVQELTKNKLAAIISVFFSFFGGSFAFIFYLIGQKQMHIDSGFGIAQPYSSALPNPAYASSIVLVIWSLYSLIKYFDTKKKKWLVMLVIFSGFAIGFKAYAGMILLGALGMASFARLFINRKVDLLLSFICAVCIAVGVFYPFNSDYGFLVFAPFLHIIKMIEGPFSFTTWDELYHIQRNIHNYFGMTKLFALVFVLFLFGNLGTRIVGIAGYFSAMKKEPLTINIYILMLFGISFFVPLFFIQPTGGAFNIYQMHWYFLFVISIFVGPGIIYILKTKLSKPAKLGIILLLFVLTLPSSIATFVSVTHKQDPAVSNEELELLHTLSKYKTYDETVFIIPNMSSFQKDELEDWFWRESDVIIAALGKKRIYLANEVVPYPYEERFERYEPYFAYDEARKACEPGLSQDQCKILLNRLVEMFSKENVKLVYVESPMGMPDHPKLQLLTKNNTANIYEVLPL